MSAEEIHSPNSFHRENKNFVEGSVVQPEMTADLAEVCGIHAGDGYMRGECKRWELDVSGGVEEKEYYDNHVAPLFEKVFGISVSPRLWPHRRTYGFVIRNRDVIQQMHSFGFPYGKKTLTVSVPDQILKSKNLDIIYRFIRGVFDTDGCLDFKKVWGANTDRFKKTRNCYPRIALNVVSKNLQEGICSLLDRTGFNYKARFERPRAIFRHDQHIVCLQGPILLEKWMQNIGFKNPSKNSRYKIWKEHGFCPTNITYGQRIQILNKEIDPHSFYSGPVA